jgi:hypothetical protein
MQWLVARRRIIGLPYTPRGGTLSTRSVGSVVVCCRYLAACHEKFPRPPNPHITDARRVDNIHENSRIQLREQFGA